MGTLSSIHAGTLSAKPFDHDHGNRIAGKCDPDRTGTLRGAREAGSRKICGNGESPVSTAKAEVGNLISSLGSLSAQAQSLPLSPPTLPGLPQNASYQPQPINYAFGDDSN